MPASRTVFYGDSRLASEVSSSPIPKKFSAHSDPQRSDWNQDPVVSWLRAVQPAPFRPLALAFQGHLLHS